MARIPELRKIAKKFNLKIISIEHLIKYRLQYENLLDKGVEVKLPTKFGEFHLIPFRQKSNGLEHVALIRGKWNKEEPVLVRVHSSCVTGDIFGSLRCDCGTQLEEALQMIAKEGKGALVYLNQEGRGIGLFNKIAAYKLQEEGKDTIQANIDLGFREDERDYGVGANIIRMLGIGKIRLISNNPVKLKGLVGFDLEIVESIHLKAKANKHNQFYLETKRDKMGHFLDLVRYEDQEGNPEENN